jgi:hypothetical protein
MINSSEDLSMQQGCCLALLCLVSLVGEGDPYHAVGASQDEPYLTLTEEMLEMSDDEQIMSVKGSMSRTRARHIVPL